ncbi:oxidoreductase [Macrococcus carouselicus]|nr:oxidoreductase [Macrococcus carouselicus]
MTNFAVIGPGAVGSVITNELRNAGLDVKLFGRKEQQITLLSAQQVKLNVSSLVVNQQQFDFIFVAIKATKIAEIKDALIKMCHDGTIIIVCQNGMGQLPEFTMAPAFQAAVYISGQNKEGHITHFRDRKLILPNHEQMLRLKTLLHDTQLEVIITDDQKTLLWYKMLVNLGINTVTALAKNTAVIMEMPAVEKMVRELLAEGIMIANSEGESFQESDIDEILAIYAGYPPDMGTSMYYDTMNNRLLEYEFIQGEFLRLAQQHKLNTPVLDICCTLLAAYQYNKK